MGHERIIFTLQYSFQGYFNVDKMQQKNTEQTLEQILANGFVEMTDELNMVKDN